MKKILFALFTIVLLTSCAKSTEVTAPSNLRITDDVLYWDTNSDSEYFKVMIDDNEYTSTDTEFSLSFLLSNNVYSIFVKNVSNGATSEEIIYSNYENNDVNYSRAFDKVNTLSASFTILTKPRIDLVKLNGATFTDYTYSEETGQLVFEEDYILPLEVGVYVYTFYTSDGVVNVSLTITDTRKPFLISEPEIDYVTGTDIVVVFDLCSGSFDALSGSDITINDYSMVHSTLTINHEFIDGLLVANPDRETVILSFTLHNGNQYTIGYLFINLD